MQESCNRGIKCNWNQNYDWKRTEKAGWNLDSTHPFAIGFVVPDELWPLFLALAVLIVALESGDYQWQKWCGEITPT